MKTRRARVIMLPINSEEIMKHTEDMVSSDGILFTDGKRIGKVINDKFDLQEQFLYIITDGEIKELP